MANLPTMQDSNITSKRNSLDKVLPLMAKDIGIIKSNFVKLVQQQTGQKAKSEAFFAKALQKENMYESRNRRGSSSSPSKVGLDKKGMLFDPKVGVFDFMKGLLNNILKGIFVGGGIYGLAKLFDNPEFKKTITDFFTEMFTVLVKGIKGSAEFLSGLTKDKGFKNAIVEAIVAISQLFIDSISMIKDVFTDDRVIKSIKDVAANLIKTIGDVLKTEVDLGKIGPVNIGKHSLGSILTTVIASMAAFRVALVLATGKLLAVGAGYKGGGGGSRGGSRGGRGGRGGGAFGLKGLGLIAGGAGLSYAGGEITGQALDNWAQNQLDGNKGTMGDDELMSQVSESSQTPSEKKEINLRDVLEMGLGVAGAYIGAKTLGGALMNRNARAAYKRSMRSQQAARNPKAPTPKPVTPSPKTPSKIILQGAGSGARDYARDRSMHIAEKGMMAGRRATLPPKGLTEKMQEKLVNFFKKIVSSGKITKLVSFISKKLSGFVVMRLTALAAAFAAAPFSAGASAVIGAIMLYYTVEDVLELYEVIFGKGGFLESEDAESKSPTPAATAATTAATSTSPEKSSSSFDYEKYKNFVGQFESSNNYKRDNTFGYIGRYQTGSEVLEQFGELKPGSYKREGVRALYNPDNWVKPGGMQAYLKDPSRQDAVMKKLTDSLYGGLQKSGVIKQGMSGSEISQRLYAAHHGGLGGANALYLKGEIRKDRYLSNSSTLTSAQKMAQAMGGSFGTNVALKPQPTETASTSPRIPSNLIDRGTQSLDDQKRLAIGAGTNVIGSFNTNNTNESKESSSTQTASVSAPWNEEMFFRDAMKGLF